MYSKIIVGHDLHEGGEDALALAQLIARDTGATLVVAGVFPFGILPRGFEECWREHENEVAAEIQQIADGAGAEAEAFPSSSPARGLQELAEETGGDLIVVGSSRHSRLGETLAGNVGLGLLQGSPCAVGLAPRGFRSSENELRTIIVGYDGSPESRLALEAAIELAGASNAQLKLVAVAEMPPVAYGPAFTALPAYPELKAAVEEQTRTQLDEAMRAIPPELKAETTLVSGDPVGALADASHSPASLLMLGSRAYGPVRRVLLGSVTSALLRSTPAPVIVQPRGARSEQGGAEPAEARSAA